MDVSVTLGQLNITNLLQLINDILLTVGMFLILPKFGINRKWAFVPIGRLYKLSQCADREKSGRILSVLEIVLVILTAVSQNILLFADPEEMITQIRFLVSSILVISVSIAVLIYKLRIYAGLCYQFGKSKKWIAVFWFMNSVPLIIWGRDKELMPKHRLDVKNVAAGDSGVTAEAMDTGLTVNIKTRSTVEFFKKFNLLRDIHMNIQPGHMVLLLGGSGAGKTTFVNAVTGYEKADAEILLNGKNVYTEYEKMKYSIGLVPQMDLMRYEDTVVHTLEDAARLRLPVSLSDSEVQEQIEKGLRIFGLRPVRDSMVEKLSGGQKKRLSIATEFICDPDLFILDEPDSGLDGVMARDLMTRLHDISREGKIVIVITHTPDRVIDLFDDVIVLAKDANHTGRLAYYGPIEEAKKFFGRDKMEEVVKCVNRKEEGGDGLADELIEKFGEAANGKTAATA